MIRRAFVQAMSCAILTTLLGVRPWRLEADEDLSDIVPIEMSDQFRWYDEFLEHLDVAMRAKYQNRDLHNWFDESSVRRSQP